MISWFWKSIDKIRCSASGASGRSLRSIAKSMRRQTSSGRCSAVSRSIHKTKTCSFRAGNDLSNDILVLKIDWQTTLQWFWHCSDSDAAEGPQSSINREIDASAIFERTLLSQFTKAKHARIQQEKIFPAISSVWELTKKNDAAVPV